MAESASKALATRQTENQPTIAELEKQLALIGSRRKRQAQDESSDESESEEEDLPPGPIDPESCLVTGAGASGGAAGSAVTFVVNAKDSAGKRITEGGDYVVATVTPKSAQAVVEAEQIAVIIKDNTDGTYTGMYTVAARGNYELTVEINGQPTGGSPYPVFFSPPEAKPSEADAAADGSLPLGLTATPNSIQATAQAVASMLQPDLAKLNAGNQAAAILAAQSSIGSEARKAGVDIPTDEEVQKRTLLIGNLSKNISADQLKQLFGFCGNVLKCDLVGKEHNYALVEYSKEQEATSALAMNNMSVMGSIIKVELTATAHAAAGAPDPVALVQARQLAQVQMMQTQHESLAAQVAQIRASARTFPGGASSSPAIPANSASQKAAALAAAAALSKRLQSLGGAPASYVPADTKRGRAYSPPRKRPRHSRTPSPPRRRPRSRPRSRSRERARSRHDSREHRSRRDSSHERRRHSAKSRSPDRTKRDGDRRRSKERHGEWKQSNDRDVKRSRRSRERDSQRKPSAKDEENERSRRRSKEPDAKPRRSRSPRKDRKEEAAGWSSHRDRPRSTERTDRRSPRRDSRQDAAAAGSSHRSKDGAERGDGSGRHGRTEQGERGRSNRRSASPAAEAEPSRHQREGEGDADGGAATATNEDGKDTPRLGSSSRQEARGSDEAADADRSPRGKRSRSPDDAAKRKREKKEKKQHKKERRRKEDAGAAENKAAKSSHEPKDVRNGNAEQDRLRKLALKQFEGQKSSEDAEGAADTNGKA